jgi:hypothetical protein
MRGGCVEMGGFFTGVIGRQRGSRAVINEVGLGFLAPLRWLTR